MESSVVVADEHPNEVKQKMHLTGKILKTSLAGAIVDVGLDKPAVLHISQLMAPSPDQAIKRVEDVVQVGQTVEVWVRKVKEDHIELTMFKPLDLEWRELKKGMTVKGKVVRLEKFGAFIEIGAERPGLIHISELAHGYVRTPAEIVSEGDEVEAQVLDVNRRKKQIKLSLKALQPEPVKVEEPARMVEAAPKERTNRRRRSGKSEQANAYSDNETPSMPDPQQAVEADPTAMEFAIREAMEKAKRSKGSGSERSRREKSASREQEEILSRTLEHKVRTS
jgi:predicted RNA-binding protein with RPS1 domain